MDFDKIPRLGVGLAADVASETPDFRQLFSDGARVDYLNVGAHYLQRERIHHYISDLFGSLPFVFHPINFNIGVADTEPTEYLDGVRAIAGDLDAHWIAQDLGVWSVNGRYLGPFLMPVILDRSSAAAAVEKVEMLTEQLGRHVAVENPPVLFALGEMHMLDYMRIVSEEADCGIVLDIGHLIGYQQAIGEGMRDMPVRTFPFERVIEVHLAGLQFSQVGEETSIIDAHSAPVHEMCWDFMNEFATDMRNLKGLTLEQEYAHTSLVSHHLDRAWDLVKRTKILSYEN